MADTGFLFPTANTVGGTGNNFINPNNMHADDGVVMTKNSGQAIADADWSTFRISGSSFTDLIPVGSTIDGLELVVEARDNFGDAGWFLNTLLSWNGETNFTAVKRMPAAGDFTAGAGTAFVVQTVGGPTDKWGRTWTRDELSDANLIARIEYSGETFAEFEGDYAKMKVYFTAPGGGGGFLNRNYWWDNY